MVEYVAVLLCMDINSDIDMFAMCIQGLPPTIPREIKKVSLSTYNR